MLLDPWDEALGAPGWEGLGAPWRVVAPGVEVGVEAEIVPPTVRTRAFLAGEGVLVPSSILRPVCEAEEAEYGRFLGRPRFLDVEVAELVVAGDAFFRLREPPGVEVTLDALDTDRRRVTLSPILSTVASTVAAFLRRPVDSASVAVFAWATGDSFLDFPLGSA